MNIYSQIKDLLGESGISFAADAPLAPLSTFKIGGTARLAVFPENAADLAFAIDAALDLGLVYRVAGNGSNILFRDGIFEGVIIFTKNIKTVTLDGGRVTAGCGASLTSVAVMAQQAGLAGLEFAYGIPGSVGGAVFMNAGAYGGQMSDVISSSVYYDAKNRRAGTLDRGDHAFAYRESRYSLPGGGDWIITSAEMEPPRGDPAEIREKMEANMRSRTEKQPLDYPSAGSVFKRCPGYYIGRIIDESGLKGYTIGGAQVSRKHAGFIINTGGATASDVLKLIDYIKEVIYKNYSIELVCEICVV